MNIFERIATHFEDQGYTWKFLTGEDTTRLTPTPEDVQKVVDKAAAKLYGSVDGSLVDVAGLIVQKNGQEFTIYVRFGEVR